MLEYKCKVLHNFFGVVIFLAHKLVYQNASDGFRIEMDEELLEFLLCVYVKPTLGILNDIPGNADKAPEEKTLHLVAPRAVVGAAQQVLVHLYIIHHEPQNIPVKYLQFSAFVI